MNKNFKIMEIWFDVGIRKKSDKGDDLKGCGKEKDKEKPLYRNYFETNLVMEGEIRWKERNEGRRLVVDSCREKEREV